MSATPSSPSEQRRAYWRSWTLTGCTMASLSTSVAVAVGGRELVDAGYRVLGIDISEAMIELSRNRVPEAEFSVGSLFEVEILRCQAVTAVSEVLNYLFDAENEERGLGRLFRRVYDALVPGGVFVFDVLGPGQVPPGTRE